MPDCLERALTLILLPWQRKWLVRIVCDLYSFLLGFSEEIGSTVTESMQASLVKAHAQPVNSQRPKTSASVARRMVSHALGVKVQVSPEQKKIEENDLREAKGMLSHLQQQKNVLDVAVI